MVQVLLNIPSTASCIQEPSYKDKNPSTKEDIDAAAALEILQVVVST
jgi:hypothetical protein